MLAVCSSEVQRRTHQTTLCHGDITVHLHSPIWRSSSGSDGRQIPKVRFITVFTTARQWQLTSTSTLPTSHYHFLLSNINFNTLRTGDADLRFYITTVQDGWRKSAFLIRACFPCTIHLITQYIEPVSEWSCWRMFIETWPHSELTFRHRASSI